MKKAGKSFILIAVFVAAMAFIMMRGTIDTHAQEGDIPIDEVHFPDEAFRAYLKNSIAQGRDVLTKAECEAVVIMDIAGYDEEVGLENYLERDREVRKICHDIKSIEGIQYFVNLQILNCRDTNLQEIDLGKCPNMISFDNCQLKSLSLPAGSKIQSISVSKNPLTQLDVKNGNSLTYLNCRDCQLDGLDLSGCPKLESLDCEGNNLTGIDVSVCPQLQLFSCRNNRLTSLDVSACPLLTNISCQENDLTNLDLTGNPLLKYVDCWENRLEIFNISGCSNLESLQIENNCIKEVDLSDKEKLVRLRADTNMLTFIDLTACTELEAVWLHGNRLTSIDVTKAENLNILDVGSNKLTSLDVGKNAELEYLDYSDNNIKKQVGLSKCKQLKYVWAYGNKGQTGPADVKKVSVKYNKNGSITCKWGKVKCDGYIVELDYDALIDGTKKNSARIGVKYLNVLSKGKHVIEIISYKKVGGTIYYGKPASKTFVVK